MPRRKPLNQTAEFQRMVRARNFIEANLSMFSQTVEFPIKTIATCFNIPQPQPTQDILENIRRVSRYNLKLTYWQVIFNRVLTQRGLYMAKRKDNFHILQKSAALRKSHSLKAQSRKKLFTSSTLLSGIQTYNSTYSHVADSELYATADFLQQ